MISATEKTIYLGFRDLFRGGEPSLCSVTGGGCLQWDVNGMSPIASGSSSASFLARRTKFRLLKIHLITLLYAKL